MAEHSSQGKDARENVNNDATSLSPNSDTSHRDFSATQQTAPEASSKHDGNEVDDFSALDDAFASVSDTGSASEEAWALALLQECEALDASFDRDAFLDDAPLPDYNVHNDDVVGQTFDAISDQPIYVAEPIVASPSEPSKPSAIERQILAYDLAQQQAGDDSQSHASSSTRWASTWRSKVFSWVS